MFTTWTHWILPNMQERFDPTSTPSAILGAKVLQRSSLTCSQDRFFSPPRSPFSLLHLWKHREDSRTASSSCVTSCLVSWCVCSCQYLCLLWIACFSPWLDTNVAHKLFSTLCGQTLGILIKLSREPNNLLQIYHMCCQFCKKKKEKQIGNKGLLITITGLCSSVASSADSRL